MVVGQARNELDQLRKKYEAENKQTNKLSPLKSRIEQLRAECDAFIDKKAEEMRQHGGSGVVDTSDLLPCAIPAIHAGQR